MAATAEIKPAPTTEAQPLPVAERCLTEVDNINRHRLPDGSHAAWVLDDVLENLVPYVKEGGIPNAVHRAEHFYRGTGEYDASGEEIKAFMWLGRTAIQNAESGRAYHRHSAALERVDVEVEEARDTEENLRPGVTKVFISPRMSQADASREVAKREHLGDDDAVRCTRAVTDGQGNIEKRAVEALLVRDIPLEAWVAMLQDPDNVFQKSVTVEDPGSALSVMKTHRELEVPDDALPEGVVSIVEAVVPYIQDKALQDSVNAQLARFREDQGELHGKADNIARRWRDFEVSLADSLYTGYATESVKSFIFSLQNKWNKDDLAVIQAHQLPNAAFRMSRELAVILEEAKQKMLWVRASVVTGNEKVLEQLDQEAAEEIYRAETLAQIAYTSGYRLEIVSLEAQTDRRIAGQKVKVGAGCPGENDKEFDDSDNGGVPESASSDIGSSSREKWKTKKGKCVVENCPTRPGEVEIGPCGVCMGRCQKIYDEGKDPTKIGPSKNAAAQKAAEVVLRSAKPKAPAESHEFSLPG